MRTGRSHHTAFLTATLAAGALFIGGCSSEQPPAKHGGDRGKAAETPSAERQQGPAENGAASLTSGDRGSANRPPLVQNAQIRVVFEHNEEVLKVFPEGKDDDGDAVTFLYAWTKNGEPAGAGDGVRGIKRGDTLSVQVTPYDGKEYGTPKRVNTVVQNTNPRVLDVATQSFKDNVLICVVKAFDPDGDPITYAIAEAPQGVTIGRETGLLTWPMQSNAKEPQSLKVKLTDGAGGEFLYTLTVNITEEKVSARPKSN